MNNKSEKSCWFESWFDSPYYHLLYHNRDESEAEDFISRLLHFLKVPPHSKTLDLACGKGRHSIALYKHGLEVIGIDLSAKSIEAAKAHEVDNLSFFIHDMRESFMVNYFDFTFNLFTSFGYFSNQRENAKVVKAVNSGLKKNGVLVIDFLNAVLVRKMVSQNTAGEMKDGGITFHFRKRIEEDMVKKDISFEVDGKQFAFTEQVQLLTLADFEKLLSPFFTIEHIFGDYKLGKFEAEHSPRLILVARKK